MEKMKNPIPKQGQEAKSRVWDCDSCLYDSFELKSFQRQLDSAIVSRTFSMPRLSEVAPRPAQPVSSKPSKISWSFHKLLRSVFRWKPASDSLVGANGEFSKNGFYGMYTNSKEVLPKIPKRWEEGGNSAGILPEYGSLVKKSASERFTSTAAFGFSCA